MEQRRIPTLLGFFIIAAGIAGTVFAVQQFSNFRSRAATSSEPQEIAITNVSDKGFTVVWLTESPAVGFINYGPTEELGINAEDDRRDNQQYTTHHVSVQGLEASTKYYFKVGSAAKLFDQNGAAYEVTTASSNDSSKRDIISGFVMKQQSEAAMDALVAVTIKDSIPLTTLTNRDGQYRIDLAQARDKNAFNQISYNSATDFVDIKVKLPPDGEATATTVTANSHPVPPITLGAINDFTKTEQPKAAQPPVTITQAPRSSSLLDNPTDSSPGTGSYERSRSALLGGSSSSNSTTNANDNDSYANPPGSLIKQESLDALGL